jgi:RecB family exonuclease
MNLDTLWQESFRETIADVEQRTGTNPVDWRSSGRVSKKYPDKENRIWWEENGQEMFAKFVEMWRNLNWKIWTTPEGVPGVEIEFNNSFGDVPVKAFADLIAVLPSGELAVVDFKTGMHTPDSAMQLGVYATLMELQFGIRPTKGYFYSARSGEFIETPGLNRWTEPVLSQLFNKFAIALKNEIFLPNIGMACSTCGVKEYCYAVGGQLAQIYDPLANTEKEKNNDSTSNN